MKARLFFEADSITQPRISGIGHTCLEILRAFDELAENDKSFTVTAIVPFGKKRYVEKYGFKNIKVRSLWPGGRGLNYLLARTSLTIPMDLWFGRGFYVFPNYKNWFVPFSQSLTFIHDINFKLNPDTLNQKNRRYLEANINRWLKRTSKVACISKSAAKEFFRYFPEYKNKTGVVYLGINSKMYHPQTKADVSAVCKKYKLPQDYFLFVGNIEPRKNLLVLLDAYKAYSDQTKSPKALILIGGDGWNNQAIRDKIHQLQDSGYAVYNPREYVPDEDLPALYSGATALVHIALNEGFGLSAVQAQACGTPVIASDLPVFHELLAAEHTSFVAPASVDDVTNTLLKHTKSHYAGYAPFIWQRTISELQLLIKSERQK